ncbi:hypothetical protein LRZ95_01820 [Candidatus Gracilibacteria bacterium]|nr:hypothetical protein [Candidatus Gracilibacteria bacterium]
MQDILKKYKKYKVLTNLNIILASLVLAFGINYFLVDNTELGKNLKASILNSENNNIKSDISINKINNYLYISSNKKINSAKSLGLSIVYNPKNITINKIDSDKGDIINLSNNPGITTIIVNFKEPTNINIGDNFVKIDISKKDNTSENLNIINANFKDINSKVYQLSTSGITF